MIKSNPKLIMQEHFKFLNKLKNNKSKIIDLLMNMPQASFKNNGDVISVIYRYNDTQDIIMGPLKMSGNSFMVVMDFTLKETSLVMI